MANRKRWALRISFGLLMVAILAGVVGYRQIHPLANVDVGYVAHQICSCVFVTERSYDSCLPDMLPELARIESEVVTAEGKNGGRAWVPIFATRTALHTPELGCSLD